MADKKVKVEVLDAVVDGHGKGEQVTLSEKSAKYFESIGYVKIVDEPKQESKKKSTPKKDESEDNESDK